MFIKKSSLSLDNSLDVSKEMERGTSLNKEKDLDSLADKFNELLQKKEKKEKEPSGKENHKDASSTSLGDEILKGMNSLKSHASVIGDAKSITYSNSKEIASFISSVADRILVATNNANGTAEVRISLKEDILPGTEVKILLENDKLTVEFLTFSLNSKEVLLSNKEILENHLKERLKDKDITVNINFSQRSEDFSSNSDGRSRGQRNLYEEMENIKE